MSLNDDGYFAVFEANVKNFTIKKLCDIVVVDRYLGSLNREAIVCMEELAVRRTEGDTFDYEFYIDSELKKLPEFKINLIQKMHVGYDLSVLRGIKI